jgi:hypothetical protein
VLNDDRDHQVKAIRADPMHRFSLGHGLLRVNQAHSR